MTGHITLVLLFLFQESCGEILNIAHRGSSGILPEHTVAAYEKAIADGADFIECDICITKDLKLVCRHESLLNFTTDIAERNEFRNKITSHTLWGTEYFGWFTVDLTLEEIKELRAVQRFDFRDQSQNGKFEIATFDEFIQVAKRQGVGIYPEIKDSAWVNSLDILPNGTRFEDIVLAELTRHGYSKQHSPCLLQSFEEETLTYMKTVLKSELRLVILFKTDRLESDLRRYALNGFYGVGCSKELVVEYTDSSKRWVGETTDFIKRCHKWNLKVHAFTFRNEDRFLAWDYENDPHQEYQVFAELEIDGIFTDFPSSLSFYLSNRKKRTSEDCSNIGNNAVAETISSLVTILISVICTMKVI